MMTRATRGPLCGLLVVLAGLVAATARADDLADWDKLFGLVRELLQAGRYQAAEQPARNMLQLSEKLAQRPSAGIERLIRVPRSRELTAECYCGLWRFDDAARLYFDAYTDWQNIRKSAQDATLVAKIDSFAANDLWNLGGIYLLLGRYGIAEEYQRRALEIRRRNLPDSFPDKGKFVADSLHDLAEICRRAGRFAEAEVLVREAVDTRLKELPDDPRTAESLHLLAELYRNQGRLLAAKPLFEQALAIWQRGERQAAALGPEAAPLRNRLALQVAKGQTSLALGCFNLWQESPPAEAKEYADKAESFYDGALESFRQLGLASHPDRADCLNNLGRFHHDRGYQGDNRAQRFAEAEKCYLEALEILRRDYDRHRYGIADTQNNLALLYYDRGEYPKAEKQVNVALDIVERDRFAPPEWHYKSHYVCAKILWKNGRKDQALRQLREAMELAEQQRALGSGDAYDLARFFGQLANAFERMVQWQTELWPTAKPEQRLRCVEEAYEAIERARGLSLFAQIALRGVDLFAGMDPAQASQLRKRQTESMEQISQAEQALRLVDDRPGLTSTERDAERQRLFKKRETARAEHQAVQHDLWVLSPACRHVLGSSHTPIPLEQLQKWAVAERVLLLEYIVGVEGTYLIVIPGDGSEPRLEELTVTGQQAQALEIEPGPLTARKCETLLRNEKSPEVHTGVYDYLKSGRHGEVLVPKLASLWELLIPEGERKGIQEGRFGRMVVIPDGALCQLPFETLVARRGIDPQYLLDLKLPVLYAPSAKVLTTLMGRKAQDIGGNVLTAGDCLFGKVVMRPSRPGAAPEIRSLKPLRFSDWEVDWVIQAFGKDRAVVLKGKAATEAAVRASLPGRRMVHLACHGLVDDAYGSLFAVLALTPGPDPANPADDGFLTLAEIYQLNLPDCELVFLSACDTNVGPEQRGEGTWALSRGFLVAGSRRVVASNWAVDDEAAASLVSYFCASLVASEKGGQRPDYAKALHEAKRWVRQRKEKQWDNPWYWAAFVLVGPQ